MNSSPRQCSSWSQGKADRYVLIPNTEVIVCFGRYVSSTFRSVSSTFWSLYIFNVLVAIFDVLLAIHIQRFGRYIYLQRVVAIYLLQRFGRYTSSSTFWSLYIFNTPKGVNNGNKNNNIISHPLDNNSFFRLQKRALCPGAGLHRYCFCSFPSLPLKKCNPNVSYIQRQRATFFFFFFNHCFS